MGERDAAGSGAGAGAPSAWSEPAAPLPETAVAVWLRHSHLPPSERLDRLVGDAQLEVSLREQEFSGPDWDFLVQVLAEYGTGVFQGWIRRGVVAEKCLQKGIRVPSLPSSVTGDREAVADIAADTVGDAINHFRDDVLVPGVWDPARGASLRTFFIGQCMRRYGNAARRWTRHYRQPPQEKPTDDLAVLNGGRVTAVEDDVIRAVTAQNLLRGVRTRRAARALAMVALDYQVAEIAADLGIGLEAAKSVLRRARVEARELYGQRRGGTA